MQEPARGLPSTWSCPATQTQDGSHSSKLSRRPGNGFGPDPTLSKCGTNGWIKLIGHLQTVPCKPCYKPSTKFHGAWRQTGRPRWRMDFAYIGSMWGLRNFSFTSTVHGWDSRLHTFHIDKVWTPSPIQTLERRNGIIPNLALSRQHSSGKLPMEPFSQKTSPPTGQMTLSARAVATKIPHGTAWTTAPPPPKWGNAIGLLRNGKTYPDHLRNTALRKSPQKFEHGRNYSIPIQASQTKHLLHSPWQHMWTSSQTEPAGCRVTPGSKPELGQSYKMYKVALMWSHRAGYRAFYKVRIEQKFMPFGGHASGRYTTDAPLASGRTMHPPSPALETSMTPQRPHQTNHTQTYGMASSRPPDKAPSPAFIRYIATRTAKVPQVTYGHGKAMKHNRQAGLALDDWFPEAEELYMPALVAAEELRESIYRAQRYIVDAANTFRASHTQQAEGAPEAKRTKRTRGLANAGPVEPRGQKREREADQPNLAPLTYDYNTGKWAQQIPVDSQLILTADQATQWGHAAGLETAKMTWRWLKAIWSPTAQPTWVSWQQLVILYYGVTGTLVQLPATTRTRPLGQPKACGRQLPWWGEQACQLRGALRPMLKGWPWFSKAASLRPSAALRIFCTCVPVRVEASLLRQVDSICHQVLPQGAVSTTAFRCEVPVAKIQVLPWPTPATDWPANQTVLQWHPIHKW